MIKDVEVLSSQLHGEGGFVQLRRMRVRNVLGDAKTEEALRRLADHLTWKGR